jgi:hypothetical protein
MLGLALTNQFRLNSVILDRFISEAQHKNSITGLPIPATCHHYGSRHRNVRSQVPLQVS